MPPWNLEVSLHESPASEKYIALCGWEAFTQNKYFLGKFCETHGTIEKLVIFPSIMFTLPHNPQVFLQRLLMETYQPGLLTSLQPYCCFQPRQYWRYMGTSWHSEDKVKMQSWLSVPLQEHHYTCWGQLPHQNPPLLGSWVPISLLPLLKVG